MSIHTYDTIKCYNRTNELPGDDSMKYILPVEDAAALHEGLIAALQRIFAAQKIFRAAFGRFAG